jgi:hypothetical protein
METSQPELLRVREIGLCELQPDAQQARSAALFVRRLPGVECAEALTPHRLRLRYDLRRVCLRAIEEALTHRGLNLDNSLLAKLRRAVVYYGEDTVRANLRCPRGATNCTQRVFVDRYQHLDHGCRDRRPLHWRHYL